MLIFIEDAIHCERDRNFRTFEEAVTELRRRASIPWDAHPNQAPCTGWKTCGREYHIVEYDVAQSPGKLLRSVAVLHISANGVTWIDGFEGAWAAEERVARH